MKILAPIALCFLAACTPWPRHGQGGMAEAGAGRQVLVEEIRLTCARDRLDNLARRGGEKAFPARLQVANLQWKRAVRAQAGGMDFDAADDLRRLETMLDELQGRLPEGTGGIRLSAKKTKGCIS